MISFREGHFSACLASRRILPASHTTTEILAVEERREGRGGRGGEGERGREGKEGREGGRKGGRGERGGEMRERREVNTCGRGYCHSSYLG